jgi:hypothetical protein
MAVDITMVRMSLASNCEVVRTSHLMWEEIKSKPLQCNDYTFAPTPLALHIVNALPWQAACLGEAGSAAGTLSGPLKS